MKLLLYTCFLFYHVPIQAQAINYCDYFYLYVAEKEHKEAKAIAYHPEYTKNKQDEFGRFLKKHHTRFDYLLFKNPKVLIPIVKLYPDSLNIQNFFCNSILHNDTVHAWLRALTPKKLYQPENAPVVFTVGELMDVASRFFYCSGIRKKDNRVSISSHICAGFNGQALYKGDKDLTLLEAFSFEAIFHYLGKRGQRRFEKNFNAQLQQSLQRNRAKFPTTEQLLNTVRDECFTAMKNDSGLRKKLLRYYRRNRSNLNFIILNRMPFG